MIASRAWVEAWAAASRTRTNASISSGPVSLTSRAAAVSLSPTASAIARNFSSAGASALVDRREQGLERFALASHARLACLDAGGGMVGGLLDRRHLVDHGLGRDRGALGLDFDPRHRRRHFLAQLVGDRGERRTQFLRPAGERFGLGPDRARSRAAARSRFRRGWASDC